MNERDACADDVRRSMGFLDTSSTAALAKCGVRILDPRSTLISPHVLLDAGVILWPGVVIDADAASAVSIGAGASLFAGARIVARSGKVTVGRDVELGDEGGFTLRADTGAAILIGDGARLLGGGSLTLNNRIGRGAQILGAIRAQNVRLGDGDGYRDPDPEARGGVLKGFGVARDLDVPQGCVIQAFGLFSEAPLRRQAEFHPKP